MSKRVGNVLLRRFTKCEIEYLISLYEMDRDDRDWGNKISDESLTLIRLAFERQSFNVGKIKPRLLMVKAQSLIRKKIRSQIRLARSHGEDIVSVKIRSYMASYIRTRLEIGRKIISDKDWIEKNLGLDI